MNHVSRIMKKGMLLLPFLLFFAVPAVQGQLTTADILGSVTDSTGAVVQKATVVLRNLATSENRTAISDASGNYVFTLLQPGRYSVKVSAPGFKASSTPNIAVEAGDRARADARLELGASSETVFVEAQTPLLQADNATVSSTIGQQEVQDLPLNGRNFVQLVQIVPGANEGPGNGLTSGARPDDRRSTAGFSVNGQDDTLNNYVVDGIDDNERIIGTIGIRPNVEGIQEITVETNSYAPEIGRTAGGVVNVVTKSGTNQFHGSVYEYFRNDKTDAYTHFANTAEPKPEMRFNQYGASVGGPILKNKTFFYGDWEGLRQVSGGTTYIESVPTQNQYNAIHSLDGLTPQSLVNAGIGTAAYPIDPVALNYLMLYPAPNSGTPGSSVNNFVSNPSKTQFSNTIDARVDHSFNTNNLFYARYGYNNVKTNTPAALPVAMTSGPLAGITAGGGRWNFSGLATDEAQQTELSFTHMFNQNMVLELKAGYTYINNLSTPLDYGIGADKKVGFGPNMTFNGQTDGLTVTSFSGLSDDGDGQYVPLNDVDNTFQYMGTLSWTRGNHNIKAGAGLIRRQARNLQSAAGFGTISNGLGTDNGPWTNGNEGASYTPQQQEAYGLASALVGAYSSVSRNYDIATPNYRSWEPSFFVQDSWRVSHNFTVIYGGRYEVFTPFTEAHNQLANYNFAAGLAAAANNNVAAAQSALLVAGQNGVSATDGIETFHGGIAPRIGFAYTLRAGTVVRGGYGLSYFPGNYTSNTDLKNAPFTSNYAPTCESLIAEKIENANGLPGGKHPACGVSVNGVINGTPGYDTLDAGLPLPTPQTINSGGLSLIAEDPKDRPAVVSQFNLQIEQQFGSNVFTVGYVGNIGQHLPEIINDVNIPVSGAATTALVTNWGTVGNARRLINVLPNLGGVGYVQSEGISNYNGLQTSFQRRLSNGLSFDLNYTWSHDMDDIVGFSEEGDQGAFNADPTKIRQIDYGTGENSIKHRFAAGLTYDIPTAQALNKIGKSVLGGWEVSTLTAIQSGKPITVENSWNDGMAEVSLGYMYGGNADRPNQIAKATLSHPTHKEWFNTAAFQVQPIGTVGNDPRNNITGPRFGHADLSLAKNFRVTEGVKAQFRAQAFNFTNQTSYYMSDTNDGNSAMGSATFGQITETDPNYNPRQFLFALKMLF